MGLEEDDVLRVEETDFNPNVVDFSDEVKVLRTALENEIKGRNLYLQYAKTVNSELARRVFAHLANEELVHIEDIRKFIKSMSLGPAVDADKMVSPGSLEDAKSLFGRLISELKQQVKISDDDNRSREIAMGLEKAGYGFYKKGADSTDDPGLKKFLLWLVEQEQSHYMLIRNAFEYINNPDSWHAGEEHWLLEG